MCFWFPRLGYWHGYNAYCTLEGGGDIVNHVISITDVAKPDSPNELKVIPTYAINSNNISSQSVSSALTAGQLSSTRKIWGNDFNGTQNIDGDIIINNKCTIKYDDTDKCIKFVFA